MLSPTMIRTGIEIGRVWRAGVVDLYRWLFDFFLVAILPHMASASFACGSKTSRAVRELQPERRFRLGEFGPTRWGDVYPKGVSHDMRR